MAVEIVRYKTWRELQDGFRANPSGIGGECVYRGHAKSEWKLASKWERWLETIRGPQPISTQFTAQSWDGLPKSYLERFKQWAIGTPGFKSSVLTDDDQWWALARHYGLVTPLLDWTRSPYVAAFFAFAEALETSVPRIDHTGPGAAVPKPDGDIAIWAMMHPRLHTEPGKFESIEVSGDDFYRQRAQRGLFTRLRDRDNCLDLQSYFEKTSKVHLLKCHIAPAAEAQTALTDLFRMNVSYGSLFPDLEGAAKQANIEAWLRP